MKQANSNPKTRAKFLAICLALAKESFNCSHQRKLAIDREIKGLQDKFKFDLHASMKKPYLVTKDRI